MKTCNIHLSSWIYPTTNDMNSSVVIMHINNSIKRDENAISEVLMSTSDIVYLMPRWTRDLCWKQTGGMYISDGLAQDCRNSNALTMELPQPYSKPSIYQCIWHICICNSILSAGVCGVFWFGGIANCFGLLWVIYTYTNFNGLNSRKIFLKVRPFKHSLKLKISERTKSIPRLMLRNNRFDYAGWQIDGDTTWPPFHRRFFQMHLSWLKMYEYSSLNISLKYIHKGPIDTISALVGIKACCITGDKALSEPMVG